MAKSPLSGKDSTLQYKLTEFIANWWQTFVLIAVLLILGFGGAVSYQAFERQKEKQAQNKLYVLHKEMQNETIALEKSNQTETAANQKGKKNKLTAKNKTPAKPAKTPQMLAKDYGSILKKYVTFIRKYENRKASYMAAIEAASLAAKYNDDHRAESILKMVINRPSKNDLFWALLNGQYAGILIHDNKCAEAIPVLNSIVNNSAYSFFRSHALLRLGACYIETKNYNRAHDALVRVQTDFPQSVAARFEAPILKRLILLRQGQKS